MTSDTTGRLKFNGLFPGIYEFKETKSPDGYELDKASHLVRISRNGSIVIDGISLADFRLNTSRIQIPTYPFSLTIPDEESKPLAGVTLRLSEGKTATTATTGSDGPAFFGALAPGTYSLAVTDVPEHYKLSDKTYTVIVDSSGQITVDGTSPAEFPLKCSRLNADASADSSADSSADDTK